MRGDVGGLSVLLHCLVLYLNLTQHRISLTVMLPINDEATGWHRPFPAYCSMFGAVVDLSCLRTGYTFGQRKMYSKNEESTAIDHSS